MRSVHRLSRIISMIAMITLLQHYKSIFPIIICIGRYAFDKYANALKIFSRKAHKWALLTTSPLNKTLVVCCHSIDTTVTSARQCVPENKCAVAEPMFGRKIQATYSAVQITLQSFARARGHQFSTWHKYILVYCVH